MHTSRTTPGVALAVALFACASTAHAAGAQWLTNYQAAVKLSQKTGKPILADFTGSDWCQWCKALHDEVFTDPEFAAWARENVILLTVDFPKHKGQAKWLKNQNAQLAERYKIKGYPTVLFLNAKGEVLGRSGYRKADASEWIDHAQFVLDQAMPKPARFAPSFTKALAQAKEESRGLMVITEHQVTERSAKKIKAMLEQPEFAKFANERLVLVHVVRSGEGAAPDDELAALKDFAKTINAPLGRFDQWVIDPTGDKPKVLLRAKTLADPQRLIKTTEDKLPTPKYLGNWLTDYNRAKAIAQSTDKPMLLAFTGSDWSGACIQLDKDVFQAEAFKGYARDHLVLVRVDFPRKTQLPDELADQNRDLSRKYEIEHLPTLLLLDGDETVVGVVHTGNSDPEKVVAQIKRFTAP